MYPFHYPNSSREDFTEVKNKGLYPHNLSQMGKEMEDIMKSIHGTHEKMSWKILTKVLTEGIQGYIEKVDPQG